MKNPQKILRIDASARIQGSVSRSLGDETVARLTELGPTQLTHRDVAVGLPFVDADWVGANFTPADQRTSEQKEKLALSDSLVDELKAADTLLIATPIYNFGIPASLKAWIDMICRAGLTFRYTENGPEGLLQDKRAIILIASGGTKVGSAIDFATPYLRHALAFIGVRDVTIIAADALSSGADAKRQEASQHIRALAPKKKNNWRGLRVI